MWAGEIKPLSDSDIAPSITLRLVQNSTRWLTSIVFTSSLLNEWSRVLRYLRPLNKRLKAFCLRRARNLSDCV